MHYLAVPYWSQSTRDMQQQGQSSTAHSEGCCSVQAPVCLGSKSVLRSYRGGYQGS